MGRFQGRDVDCRHISYRDGHVLHLCCDGGGNNGDVVAMTPEELEARLQKLEAQLLPEEVFHRVRLSYTDYKDYTPEDEEVYFRVMGIEKKYKAER